MYVCGESGREHTCREGREEVMSRMATGVGGRSTSVLEPRSFMCVTCLVHICQVTHRNRALETRTFMHMT